MIPDADTCGHILEGIQFKLKETLNDIDFLMEYIGYKKYVPPEPPDNPFPKMEIGETLEFHKGWVGLLEKRRCYEKKKNPDKKFKLQRIASRQVISITRIN